MEKNGELATGEGPSAGSPPHESEREKKGDAGTTSGLALGTEPEEVKASRKNRSRSKGELVVLIGASQGKARDSPTEYKKQALTGRQAFTK